MGTDRSGEIAYLREKAKRLREIADEHESEVSQHLRMLAFDMEFWATHLERRKR